MAEETKTIVVRQTEGERFALDHHGGVTVRGDAHCPAQVVHGTAPQRPLVHMVCWDSDDACKVEVEGRVALVGDEKAPVRVEMRHTFANDHHQTHVVEPLDHSLKVATSLAEPVHHALQLRTPLQVRFCNPWHVASDYAVELKVGKASLISIRITGATVATPQPCDEPCPPPKPAHPHRP